MNRQMHTVSVSDRGHYMPAAGQTTARAVIILIDAANIDLVAHFRLSSQIHGSPGHQSPPEQIFGWNAL